MVSFSGKSELEKLLAICCDDNPRLLPLSIELETEKRVAGHVGVSNLPRPSQGVFPPRRITDRYLSIGDDYLLRIRREAVDDRVTIQCVIKIPFYPEVNSSSKQSKRRDLTANVTPHMLEMAWTYDATMARALGELSVKTEVRGTRQEVYRNVPYDLIGPLIVVHDSIETMGYEAPKSFTEFSVDQAVLSGSNVRAPLHNLQEYLKSLRKNKMGLNSETVRDYLRTVSIEGLDERAQSAEQEVDQTIRNVGLNPLETLQSTYPQMQIARRVALGDPDGYYRP